MCAEIDTTEEKREVVPPGSSAGETMMTPSALKRSVFLSAMGSVIGTFFFALLGGNIWNRYLEAVGMINQIDLFMAITAFASVLQIFGSWALQRSGKRQLYFFGLLGLPRTIWFAMITVPLWAPEDQNIRVLILGAMAFVYWVTSGWGSNAWFSWMRDLVPERYRGRYWAYRSIMITVVSATWGLYAGYYLEEMKLSLSAFEVIYGVGVVCGLLDITCFFWVGHPKMEVKHGEEAGMIRMIKAAMHPKFLKFIGVLSILWFSSSFEGLAGYYMMRGIGMEIYSMQMLGLFGTCVYVVFGILWGFFLDRYGSKATFIIGMTGSILPPFIVMLAPYYGEVALYAAAAVGTIMSAALGLSAMNLLCSLSKREDQAMTVAANSVIAGAVQATGVLVCGRILFPVLKSIGSHFGYGPLFYAMVIYAIIGVMRIVSGIWSLRMPEVEAKPPAVIAVRMFYTTNPLRAFYSMGRFLIAKSSDLVHKKGDTDLHPSARWRLG